MAKLVDCKICSKEVSSKAKNCPHCGQKLRSGAFVTILKWIGIILVALTVLGLILPDPEEETQASRAIDTQDVIDVEQLEPVGVEDIRPQSQIDILLAVDAARSAARLAANDMQKGAALAERSAAFCNALPGGKRISDWTGEIYSISANGDGKGVLVVTVGDDVWASTWNNALSDIGTNSLIEPGTDLFASVSAMSPGDAVRFSGEFFTDAETCMSMHNLFFDGKITDPEFVFRFSSVEAL